MRTGVELLDRSLQTTLEWVGAVDARMNTRNPRLALTSLQSTLQSVRDQMTPAQAVRFADHLPLPLKGAFFEGWHPSATPRAASRDEFLARIEATAFRRIGITVERAVKASLEVLSRHIPAQVMVEASAALPPDLRSLWPDGAPPYPDARAAPPPH